VGGISPIGQKGRLPVVIDTSARSFETVYVSAGRRGLQVQLPPAELIRVTSGRFADITAH
jgi:Cys-tRNA(Pro)/Cys-tRNA(Cys) deacylase